VICLSALGKSNPKFPTFSNHQYSWALTTTYHSWSFSNNAFEVEGKVLVGARGWVNLYKEDDNYKILKRGNDRLKLSIAYANKEFDNSLEKIAFIHYPPFYKESVPEEIDFIKTLKDNNIKRCFYGHLHGPSHKDAFEGMLEGIEFKLISSDFLDFNLIEIKWGKNGIFWLYYLKYSIIKCKGCKIGRQTKIY
jgi:predicted phosphohydrolase